MSDLERLRTLLEAACDHADFPGPFRARAMFGGLTAYAGERNFASVSNVGLALKLSKADRETLLGEGGKPLQYDPDATPSKTAVVLPESIVSDAAALREWAFKSARYVAALAPPKPRRAR